MSQTDSDRDFLKADRWDRLQTGPTDQQKGVPPPPIQKPCPAGAQRIDLFTPDKISVEAITVPEAIGRRRSRRRYAHTPLTLEELSYLLWATQGVQRVFEGGAATFRTVPSAGARHAFETYLIVQRVAGLKPGLYRYLALDHKLCLVRESADLGDKAVAACHGQAFVRDAPVIFVWTAVPYRMEWRYGAGSYKIMAIDVGHVCQNLYIACEAIQAGACAIAAYNQSLTDALVEVDGEEEFAIYIAPVGKVE